MIQNFIAAVENNAGKSGKIIYNERTNEMENKAVEAIILPSFLDKMTSCSSLTWKYEDDTDNVHGENQKIQPKQQQQRCLESQPVVANDISSSSSINILEDVVRCLLNKDTSALGFQIAQRSDGICISYVEPNGPADRSGNIFVGDKIKELTIAFENMPITDALTILSCASTYKIRLELERAIIEDAIQQNYTEMAKQHPDVSLNPNQQFSSLYKSHSTSDLILRLQKSRMPGKTVNGGSFMSNQKYQLPQQSIINTIREEASSIASETFSQSSPPSELIPTMKETFISEETILIRDESSGSPVSIMKNHQPSPSEISSYETSPQVKNQPCMVTSETRLESKYISDSASLQQETINEHTVLSLTPEENYKVDEINYNGCSEFIERSHFVYSNTSIKDDIQKSCIEFCELIEPKRESIVIEFEEDQANYKATNSPKCDGINDEAENDLQQTDANTMNDASLSVNTSTCKTIELDHAEKDETSGNTSIVANAESCPSVATVEAPVELLRSTDVTENKCDTKNSTKSRSPNDAEEPPNLAPSVAPNHLEINELKSGNALKDNTLINELSVTDSGEKISNDTLPNSISQRSPKRSRLRKLSGNCGVFNEGNLGKNSKKLNGTAEDEGNSRSNILQRSPKWNPKHQSQIPVVTRTPSTKSKNKFPKIENNKVVDSPMHQSRAKTVEDGSKDDMNGASLYIAKKEALRKTYLPFSKINKSEEMDLNKERKARLEANQALLQKQQEELRTLGILP
uniref:PDZ domain-containing protein n=1 Tax=Setaria digitata TaxID=48799 RepID=A0A915PI55_9BILA